MVRNYDKRHFFMAIGIGILFISPILLIFIPPFIANSIYFTSETWVVILPGISYIVYATGCALLLLVALTIYFANVSKLSIGIGIIITILSIVLFFAASKPYISLSENGISYRATLMNEYQDYSWNEIDLVNYHEVPIGEGFSEYQFFFQDGRSLTIPENGYVRVYKKSLHQKFYDEKIEVN